MTFYTAGQALAALDSPRVVAEAGENLGRSAYRAPCRAWHDRVFEGGTADLACAPVGMTWITYQHSNHYRGLPSRVASGVQLQSDVDIGEYPTKGGVRNARAGSQQVGASHFVVAPGRTDLPDGGDAHSPSVVPDSIN